MKNHIKIKEGWYVIDHKSQCWEGEYKCVHLVDNDCTCSLFDVDLDGWKNRPPEKCSICLSSWNKENKKRQIEKEISNTPTHNKKEHKRCIEFLKLNGWKSYCEDNDPDSEFVTFNKTGCISVDVSDSELVFLGETGDFLHRPIDYFTLIGVLVSYRQLAINFNQVHK